MGEDWVVLGEPPLELAKHAAWDLLTLPAPQVRALPATQVAVVLPRSREPHREVYLERCERDHVPVVRRPSGGGAVVLAPGVVTVSVLAPLSGPRNSSQLFARFCGLVAQALQQLGVPRLELRGVSDLCLGDRKVVGSSLRLLLDTVLFQASVLVDADLSLLEHYLPFPSRAPDYRQGRSHRHFVTTLAQAGFPVKPEAVAAALEHEFRQALASGGGSG